MLGESFDLTVRDREVKEFSCFHSPRSSSCGDELSSLLGCEGTGDDPAIKLQGVGWRQPAPCQGIYGLFTVTAVILPGV